MDNKKTDKKVGIITLYHNNYNFGGLLQAYALPKVLKDNFNIKSEQIDYIPYYQDNKITNEIRSYNLYALIYKIGIIVFDKFTRKKLNKRKIIFDAFINEIPHSDSVYEYSNISKSVNDYDLFICGGDQIWNNQNEIYNIKTYTLQFVPSNIKKIAYAPSMAILETTSNFKKIMKKGLEQLDAISIREKKSLSILKEMTDKNINVVVDPVLLINRCEWEKELRTPKKKEKYVLVYLLGDSIEYRKSVKKYAHCLSLPTLTFPHIFLNVVRKSDLFFGDIHDYTSGPREFIGLIKNAELVITDSFHACVFSMIFKTPFYVFERNKAGEKGNMNSRIYDFLEEYHLEKQLVTTDQLDTINEIPQVDFTYAHEHWDKRRKESLEYLEKALKD